MELFEKLGLTILLAMALPSIYVQERVGLGRTHQEAAELIAQYWGRIWEGEEK